MKKFITVLLVTTGLSNFAFGLIDELGGAVKTGFADAINNVENFAKGGIDIAVDVTKGGVDFFGNVLESTGHKLIDAAVDGVHTTIDFGKQTGAAALTATDFAFQAGAGALQTGSEVLTKVATGAGKIASVMTGSCNCK